MKNFPAIGLLEFDDIPAGISATDALLKDAPVAFLRTGLISPRRYLTVVAGSPAAVEHSLQEARFAAGDHVEEWIFLPDAHEQLRSALMQGSRRTPRGAALLALTVATCCSCVLAAEACLKGTPTTLLELRLADPVLNGQAFLLISGALPDVEAAAEISHGLLKQRQRDFSLRVISAPHESLMNTLGADTEFNRAREVSVPGADVPAQSVESMQKMS